MLVFNPFVIIILGCCLLFIAIGLVSFRRATPMPFWSGTQVTSREIRDVSGYNRASGVMWIFYGLSYLVALVSGFIWGQWVGGALLLICSLGGFLVLIWCYKRIYQKYAVDQA